MEATGAVALVSTDEPAGPAYVSVTPGVDLFPDTTTGVNIPIFYEIFLMASDITGWPIQIFWIAGAFSIAMMAGALAAIYLRSMLIAAIVTGTATVVFCSMGIIPWWVLYVYGFMALCLVIYQRVVSV